MTIVSSQPGKATLELTIDELLMINNALNEVCNALDVSDFETRMGCSREDIKKMLEEVSDSYEQVSTGA